MNPPDFGAFFCGNAREHLLSVCERALLEDGNDLTSEGIFSPDARLNAHILAKQDTVIAGLPIIPLVLDMAATSPAHLGGTWHALVKEGEHVTAGTVIARLSGQTCQLLRAERVVLNMLSHLCGIATVTRAFVDALEGTGVRLLDTRKTLPGLRYPDKYAVLCGGAVNHRMNLTDMLMLKDNHIDAAGSIARAVDALRSTYAPCPPIEVECRTCPEVQEAVACHVERIMLDNMSPEHLIKALTLIPSNIEAEISGNVTLDTIRSLATLSLRRPDFISVGRITHSAPAADLSMRLS